MTEQMFGRVPLNLVVTAIKDGTHGTHARVDNGIPFLSAKNITDSGEVSWNETDDRISDSEYEQIHRVFQLQPRDLLLTIVGSLGRRAVFDGARVTFQRSVAYVRPDRRRVSERFLFHWFAHGEFQRELVRRSNSTAQAGLYLGELAQTLVPDCPLTEQIKIAEVLDTLDTTIRQTEAIIDKLKQVKQGLLHDLLTRGIADNGELRPPQSEAPHLYKESALGWLPACWTAAHIQDLASFVTSGSRGWAAHYSEAGALFIRSQNVRMGYLDFSDRQHVRPPSGSEGQRTKVAANDLLVTITGNGVGNLAFVPAHWNEEAFVSQHVGLVRFFESRLAQLAMLYLVEGAPGNHQLVDAQYGQSKPGLNLENLRRLQLPVPPTIEQVSIVERLGGLQDRIELEKLSLAQNRMLKSGLMDDLLTGRVRVTALLNAET